MYSINSLDFGLTTRCNAGCAQCHRTNPDTLKGWDWMKTEEHTLETITKIVPPEFFNNHLIKTISICGGYGDPLLTRELFDILKYFIKHATYADIFIATNGAMKRGPKWWHALGTILSKSKNRVEITFGLDGIDNEMHAFHRKHTELSVALRNAKILQLYGIETCWQYIIFKHNEAYLEQAKEMAKKHNFSRFSTITATRTPVNGLEPPKDLSNITTSRNSQINRFKGITEYDGHACISEKNKEVHIPANGFVVPCCFLDERYFIWRYLDEHARLHGLTKDTLPEDNQTVQDIRTLYNNIDMNEFNAIDKGLEAVLDNPWWDEFLNNRDKFKIHKCNDMCGVCK